jgi:lipopolysaccharide/colanic/teichoic acid biosynthesis glycosyltransferase
VQQAGWRLKIKRCFDVGGAAAGLLLCSPLIAVTYFGIRYCMGSPVLFKQPRGGRGQTTFMVFKFRTMRDAYTSSGEPLSDAERLTTFGRLLRSLSIDELPQLLNVLRGEMSLVGPRPHLSRYLSRYSPRQARRHEVLPGITGWAQVNGRNALTYEERFELDVWYVEHWSLALDAQILWRTVATVVGRSGIASESHSTMPEFMGSSVPVSEEC